MQLNKASKKTAKPAEKPEVAGPEKAAEAALTSKPRTSKSSKPKKSELTEMASGTHHHKTPPATVSEPVAVKPVVPQAPAPEAVGKSLVDTPSRTIHPNQIAELAYSYWLERGRVDGSSEEDWLRAEKALAAAG